MPADPARHARRPGPPTRPAVPADPARQARRPGPPSPPTRPAEPTSRDMSAASAAIPLTRPASYFQLPAHQRQLAHFPLLLSKNVAISGDPPKNVAIAGVGIYAPLHAHRRRR